MGDGRKEEARYATLELVVELIEDNLRILKLVNTAHASSVFLLAQLEGVALSVEQQRIVETARQRKDLTERLIAGIPALSAEAAEARAQILERAATARRQRGRPRLTVIEGGVGDGSPDQPMR
jgi:hypothetical protein